MSKEKPALPKGTRDFGPLESAKRGYIINTIKKNFKKFGFNEIGTPAMEQLTTLTGKYGDEGDRLLFKILNSGDFLKDVTTEDFSKGTGPVLPKIAEKGLRYDLTVPFARFVVQNRNEITLPFRRFQIQPVWRADRPQKGRYREFYQCDADIIGSNSIFNEVELATLIQSVFHDLGYNQFLIKVNHRELLYQLASHCEMKGNEIAFCTILDKLDKIGLEKVTQELIDLGADKSSFEVIENLITSDLNHTDMLKKFESEIGQNQGTDSVREFFQLLGELDQVSNIRLDLSLARGLTYYTGMIFEVVSTDVKIGSICGGGRYDNLTGVFGLPDVSGIGISFGLDRIYDVMEEKELFPDHLSSSVKLLITHFDQQSFNHGIKLLNKVRENEIDAMIYPDQIKINKQLNYANKINAEYVVMIGTEEIEKGLYTVKHMKSGDQQSLVSDDLINLLTSE